MKEGHTYWLYRAKGDDIVKLYDLSSICTGVNLTQMNPFSTPVAMLCFKVSLMMIMVHFDSIDKSSYISDGFL